MIFLDFNSLLDLIDRGDDNEEEEMDYDPSTHDNEADGKF